MIQDKLSEIISRLERIEQRQIKTSKLVETIEKEEEGQVQGSFGTTERGK